MYKIEESLKESFKSKEVREKLYKEMRRNSRNFALCSCFKYACIEYFKDISFESYNPSLIEFLDNLPELKEGIESHPKYRGTKTLYWFPHPMSDSSLRTELLNTVIEKT